MVPCRHFASDNYAGICPAAFAALAAANVDHAPGYGDDRWTAEVSNRMRTLFGTDCEVFFTFNGTAANSLALATLCRSYHAIICARLAHVETDECGAPEFFSGGTKVLTAGGEDGKLTPADIDRLVHARTDLHYPKPKAISLTQATEVGTVYSVAELRELGATAHGLGLKVHLDGARLANAVVELGCTPMELTWKAGVDVVCFGGTKNGLAVGDAVIFFDRDLAEEFEWRCKQAGQLASKMRFLSAPWLGLLDEDVWLANARHANAMAECLREEVVALGLQPLFPRQANSVFVPLPPPVQADLRAKGWRFYDFIGAGGCRLMCSWDTTAGDVADFVADLAAALGT